MIQDDFGSLCLAHLVERLLDPLARCIEELLFAAAFGAYWSSIYEHFTWQRLVAADEGTAGRLLDQHPATE
jgi:hypothetical protein